MKVSQGTYVHSLHTGVAEPATCPDVPSIASGVPWRIWVNCSGSWLHVAFSGTQYHFLSTYCLIERLLFSCISNVLQKKIILKFIFAVAVVIVYIDVKMVVVIVTASFLEFSLCVGLYFTLLREFCWVALILSGVSHRSVVRGLFLQLSLFPFQRESSSNASYPISFGPFTRYPRLATRIRSCADLFSSRTSSLAAEATRVVLWTASMWYAI